MTKVAAQFTLNGQEQSEFIDSGSTLLSVLRGKLGLYSTKAGCHQGTCGACTVIIDGRATTSCSVAIGALEGATVTTIEGLPGAGSHPVQQAWLAEQVTMCGYCEPGFIMAIAALLESSPTPSEEQIAALPNICRCGAYPRIKKAIARAAQGRATSPNFQK